MKKKFLFTSIVIVLGFCCFSAGVSAQTLNNILKKFQKSEIRLEQLEASLKNELEKHNVKHEEMNNVQYTSELNNSIIPLLAQIEQLQRDIKEIRNEADNREDRNFSVLVAEFEVLIYELQTTIEEQLASVQEAGSASLPVEEHNSITVFGYGDFFCAVGNSVKDYSQIHIGEVEIDLEAELDEKTTITGALAFDSDNETFGIGELFVDFHLFGSEGDHFPPVSRIEHSGILVGQFDVPFGIDWQVYSSIDRKLVSGPLVVENTHDFWNDYGVQGHFENRRYNAVVFFTNGFGYDDVDMKIALGGRLGVMPFERLEIGASYSDFLNENYTSDMSLKGFDFRGNYDAISVKGEYIEQILGLAGNDEVVNSGFYCQGTYDFGKYFLVGRYDMFSPAIGEDITRISAGGGCLIREGVELRVEYQADEEEKDQTYLKIVFGL